MKRYRLLKDYQYFGHNNKLLTAKSGAILKYDLGLGNYCLDIEGQLPLTVGLSIVESNPEWFEEVKEPEKTHEQKVAEKLRDAQGVLSECAEILTKRIKDRETYQKMAELLDPILDKYFSADEKVLEMLEHLEGSDESLKDFSNVPPNIGKTTKEIKYYKRVKAGDTSPFKVGEIISTDTLKLKSGDWQETTKEEYDKFIANRDEIREQNKKDVQMFYDRFLQQIDYTLKQKGIIDAPQGAAGITIEDLDRKKERQQYNDLKLQDLDRSFFLLTTTEQQLLNAVRKAKEAGMTSINQIVFTSHGIIVVKNDPITHIHVEKN